MMSNFLNCFFNLSLALILAFICSAGIGQNVALHFDGSNDYVQTTYSGISGSAARTVEAWVKTTANCDPNNGGKQKVIVDWGSTATGGRFTVNLLFGNAARIEIGGSGLTAKTAINDGNWHHIAVVYDPAASNKYRILVDGILDTAGNITTSINTTNSVKMLIGSRVDAVNYFDGDIDEVRVFNVARTDSAIKADMNKEICSNPSDLVAYYKLNEGNANSNNSSKKVASDYAGGAYNGSLINFGLSGTGSNWSTGKTLVGGDSKSTINVFECSSYTSPSGNHTWDFDGTYFDTIANTYGCDSFITVKLTIGKSGQSVNITRCDSFVSDGGKKYISSGNYTETYKSAKGCDSSIFYTVKINSSDVVDVTVAACDSFVSPMGYVHHVSGDYKETYTNVGNCDSIVTYHVTVNITKVANSTYFGCDSVFKNDKWYFDSTVLELKGKTMEGCDSTHRITLLVNRSHVIPVIEVKCDSFISPFGIRYLKSGTYPEIFKNKIGCDSVMIYQLAIDKGVVTSQPLQACDSMQVNNKWYYASEKFSVNFATEKGCDSTIRYDLEITSINRTITQKDDELTVNEADADTYEWIDCMTNEPIMDGVNQVLKRVSDGQYKVVMTKNSCEAETECFVVSSGSLNKFNAKNTTFNIKPNPNKGTFAVNFTNVVTGQYYMYNALGMLMLHGEMVQTNQKSISANLSPGLYFIRVDVDGNFDTKAFYVSP